MPYPLDPPKAKHDLLTPVLPQPSSSTSDNNNSSTWFKTAAALFAALDDTTAANNLQPLTSVYSYRDAPPDKPLSRELLVIGLADPSLVRQLLPTDDDDDKSPCVWHHCTVAVKRADGDYGRRLPGSDLEKCRRFAQFLHRLKRQEAVAVLARDKYQRFGLLVPTDDMTTGYFNDDDDVTASDSMDQYDAQDFSAMCYVGRIDQVKEYLERSGVPPPPAVAFATNGGDHSNTSEGCWQPTNTSSTGIGTSLMEYDTNDNNDPWAAADPWNINNADDTTDVGTTTTTAALESSFHADAGAAAADRFYSGLTRTLATRADSRIYHMRAYNGWVKATQISELDPQINNNNKRKKLGPPLRVLDLACGKGGDLGKWVLHPRGIQNYVGIDVARGSLVDAALRVRSMRHKLKRCTFTCADLGADVPGRHKSPRHPHMQKLSTWSLQNEPEHTAGDPVFQLQRGGGIALEDKFDVVSVQFAIHYMMQTRKRARRFFQTVSELLEVGGNLICTTIDARVVIEHLMNLGLDLHFDGEDSGNKEDAVISVGNGACRLIFKSDIVKKIFQRQPVIGSDSLDENLFGLEYTFSLVEGTDHASGVGDAVNLPEWLIPIPVLQALGEEAGLEIEYAQNFHEFYTQRKDASICPAAHAALYNMKVLNRNGTISDDEYEISRLYCAIQFRKAKESRINLEEDGDEVIEEDENELVDIDPAIKAKFLPMALLKAKRAAGADAWATFSNDEKNRLTEVELRKMAIK